jgi:hypothetical protein
VNAVLTRIEILDDADKKDLFALFREWEKCFASQNATDIEECRVSIEEILLQEPMTAMEMELD